jgi:hypothetical protein
MLGVMGHFAPRLNDKVMEKDMSPRLMKDAPKSAFRPNNLCQTQSALQERGSYEGTVFQKSIVQQVKLHPLLTGAILLAGELYLLLC